MFFSPDIMFPGQKTFCDKNYFIEANVNTFFNKNIVKNLSIK